MDSAYLVNRSANWATTTFPSYVELPPDTRVPFGLMSACGSLKIGCLDLASSDVQQTTTLFLKFKIHSLSLSLSLSPSPSPSLPLPLPLCFMSWPLLWNIRLRCHLIIFIFADLTEY